MGTTNLPRCHSIKLICRSVSCVRCPRSPVDRILAFPLNSSNQLPSDCHVEWTGIPSRQGPVAAIQDSFVNRRRRSASPSEASPSPMPVPIPTSSPTLPFSPDSNHEGSQQQCSDYYAPYAPPIFPVLVSTFFTLTGWDGKPTMTEFPGSRRTHRSTSAWCEGNSTTSNAQWTIQSLGLQGGLGIGTGRLREVGR